MDLALASPEELLTIIREAGLRGDPSTWPRQAALAASGNTEELQQYQDELQGGREA